MKTCCICDRWMKENEVYCTIPDGYLVLHFCSEECYEKFKKMGEDWY